MPNTYEKFLNLKEVYIYFCIQIFLLYGNKLLIMQGFTKDIKLKIKILLYTIIN